MKRSIFFILTITTIIIILSYFFNINNYKNFSEVIDYKIAGNNQIFIEESYNTNMSSIVEVNKKDFDELIRLISSTKYRKVVDYTFENTTRYQITSNDSLKKFYLIVDEFGLRLGGNSLKRYIIREEKLNIILDYLEDVVDKSETKEGSVTKADFNYINSNLAKNISITEFLKRTNIDFKTIIIKRIALSVSGDGYINSINIAFYNRDNTIKSILVYDRGRNILKFNEYESQFNDVLKETNNTIILNGLDYLLKESKELKDYRSKRLIDLHKPYKVALNDDNKKLYYNGKATEIEEKIGIVFSIFDMPSSKDNDFKFHIFDENLDL